MSKGVTWFIKGSTDNVELQKQMKIWNGNATEVFR